MLLKDKLTFLSKDKKPDIQVIKVYSTSFFLKKKYKVSIILIINIIIKK